MPSLEPDDHDVKAPSHGERSAETARLRHAVADTIRAHTFQPSRPWPDGSKPEAPNWNPGCSCGDSLYYFEHDLHLADAILAISTPPGSAGDARG